ncbi:MAG: endonuclease NucS [Propionibacteriaceae bacterium]|nr:endonuclease NucS [Propionibacteriaceae bacterium]
MRLIIARCQVDYTGRLTAHLPLAPRLIMVKADGSISVHADDGAYKPLNWMTAPCTTVVEPLTEQSPRVGLLPEGVTEVWRVTNRSGDALEIAIAEILDDVTEDLGRDPGLRKDGVEKHLQALLAENPTAIRGDLSVVQREYPTPIGPVDLLCRTREGAYVAVEVKRRGEIDGVEQLTRYVDLLRRDPLLGEVTGILAAQQIKRQARVLAQDRGFGCVVVDYDELRGIDHSEERLF